MRYLDFGNLEEREIVHLAPLPLEVQHQPCVAVRCSLDHHTFCERVSDSPIHLCVMNLTDE